MNEKKNTSERTSKVTPTTTSNAPLKRTRTRNKPTQDKKELRLIVKRELYDLVAKHAARYGETVGGYIRHLMMERVEALERVEAHGTTSTVMDVFRDYMNIILRTIDDPEDIRKFNQAVKDLYILVRKYTN